MANSLVMNGSTPVAGLGTSAFTVTTTGAYQIDVETTLPLGSGVQIVVNNNGSPVLTVGGATTNPTPTQLSLGGQIRTLVTAGNAISVVLSSSNAVDSVPNAVKSNITLFQTV